MSEREVSYEDYLGSSEDGDWTAYRREGLTKWRARRLVADWCMVPVTDLTVRAGHARPASKADGDEEIYVDEGWHFECKRTHPQAIPVWVVGNA